MSNETKLINFYSNNLSDQLNKMVAPLETTFGLNCFCYTYLDSNGGFIQIGNQPSVGETYLSEGLYKFNPLFTHPNNYKGVLPIITDELKHDAYHQAQDVIKGKYGFKSFLCIPLVENDHVHLFQYSSSKPELPVNSVFFHNRFALEQFGIYFLENWRPKFNRLESYFFNIADVLGPKYFQRATFSGYSSIDEKLLSFGKQIGLINKTSNIQLLSKREKDCIEHLLEGKTAIQIGEELSINHRTVSHYLENVKMKLGCYSKSELFDVLLKCKKLGCI